MVTYNQPLVRQLGELGILGAHISTAGTASQKLGGDMTCAISDNSYALSFTGFKVAPIVITTEQDTACNIQILSVSTSTCTIGPKVIGDGTTRTVGGTKTTAAFDVMIMGPAYL